MRGIEAIDRNPETANARWKSPFVLLDVKGTDSEGKPKVLRHHRRGIARAQAITRAVKVFEM